MKEMIFGNVPTFRSIIDTLGKLERTINAKKIGIGTYTTTRQRDVGGVSPGDE